MALSFRPQSPHDEEREGEYRWTVDAYLAAVQAGLLDQTELLDGRIYRTVNAAPIHNRLVFRLGHALRSAVGFDYVIEEKAIHLPEGEIGEPEPDVTVLNTAFLGLNDTTNTRADAIRCVIEVAVSTTAKDLNIKLPLYRRADLPAAYIVVVDDEHRTASIHSHGTDSEVRAVIEAVVGDEGLELVEGNRLD